MPDAPAPHITVTVRTTPGVAPGTLLIPLTGGHRRDDRDRPLDDTRDLDQGVMHHMLDRGQRLGGLHAIIPDTLQAFGKHMLDHAPNAGRHVDGFPCHPLALMRALMRGHALPIIVIDPPS